MCCPLPEELELREPFGSNPKAGAGFLLLLPSPEAIRRFVLSEIGSRAQQLLPAKRDPKVEELHRGGKSRRRGGVVRIRGI